MDTLDIMTYICEKREEFVVMKPNESEFSLKQIDPKKMSLNRIEIYLIILLVSLALMMVFK